MATWDEVVKHVGKSLNKGAYLPEWKKANGSKDMWVCNHDPFKNGNLQLDLHDFSKRNETRINAEGEKELLPEWIRFRKTSVPSEFRDRTDWILD